MAEVQSDVKTVEVSRQHLLELANSGNMKKAGLVTAPKVTPVRIAPAIRPPVVPQAPKANIPQVPKANVSQPPAH
jgi:hypothetical protein